MGEVEYESPQLTVIGSVSELTEQVNKIFGNADPGITFQNEATSITNP